MAGACATESCRSMAWSFATRACFRMQPFVHRYGRRCVPCSVALSAAQLSFALRQDLLPSTRRFSAIERRIHRPERCAQKQSHSMEPLRFSAQSHEMIQAKPRQATSAHTAMSECMVACARAMLPRRIARTQRGPTNQNTTQITSRLWKITSFPITFLHRSNCP